MAWKRAREPIFGLNSPPRPERERDRNGVHIVEYVRMPPWRDAGQRKKVRAPGRREATLLAKDLRRDGCQVTAVRRKRWFE